MTRLADKPRPLRRAKQKLKSLNQQLRENKREPEAAAEEKSEQKANTSFLLWGHRKAYVGLYIFLATYHTIDPAQVLIFLTNVSSP